MVWWALWAQLAVVACAVLSVVAGDTLRRAWQLKADLADASVVVDRFSSTLEDLEAARAGAGVPQARVFDDPADVRPETDAARARYAAYRAGRRTARAGRDRALQERWARDEL